MLPRVLKRFFSKSKPRTALDALEAGCKIEPAGRDLSRLVPIILPLELFNLGWPGPIVRIGQLPFCAAWAVRGEMNTFFYVTHGEAHFWDEADVDWRALALQNLLKMAEDQPASGDKLDDEGRPFVKVLLHDDAVGPSRLLIPHLFDDELGTNYQVAVPEQTCAVAYRKNLNSAQAADVDGIIKGCFARGTEPMSSDRFAASEFWDFVQPQVHC